MCDENASCEHDSKTDTQVIQKDIQVSLLDLPIEVFLHICSFLDTPTLAYTLSPVCKKFYHILGDDFLWKARVNHMWKDASYPILPLAEDNDLFWKSACLALQREKNLWECKTFQKNFLVKYINRDTILCTDEREPLRYSVDSLLLMHSGTTCICVAMNPSYGDTYCSLVYFKLPMQEDEREKIVVIEQKYDGWIHDLTSIDDTIYCCDSKGSIKSWVFANTGFIFLKTYETDSSLKCTSSYAEQEDFATSSFDKNKSLKCISSCAEKKVFATCSYNYVFVFNTRFHKPIAKYRPYYGTMLYSPVTGGNRLAMNSSYILTASNKLTIWDQRVRQILRYVNIPGDASPTCVSMYRDWFYIGDSIGKLHVLKTKNDFEIVKSYVIDRHKKSIKKVHQTRGCLITGLWNGTIRISSPTDPPKLFAKLKLPDVLLDTDYQNGVFAISNLSGISIWQPKWMYSSKDQ